MIEWIMLEWVHKQISKSLIRRVRNFVDTSLELGYGNEQWFLDFFR